MAISAAEATARSRAAFGLAPSLGGGVSAPAGGIVQAPPMRGIYGWYDPRMQGLPQGVPITTLRDSSGLEHHLTDLYGNSARRYAYDPNPVGWGNGKHAITGVSKNFGGTPYAIVHGLPTISEATFVQVCSFPFWHNSNTGGVFFQPLADNYMGPLYGSVTGGKPSQCYGAVPISNQVMLPVGSPNVVSLTFKADPGNTTIRFNGGDPVTAPSVGWDAAFRALWTAFGVGAGNNFGSIGTVLVYTVALTTEEVFQAETYIAHVHNLW